MSTLNQYIVHFSGFASQGVSVEHEGPFDAQAIDDAAWQELDTTLCHQCSKVELGDFEAIVISDEDGEEVWSAPDEADQRAVSELETVVGQRGDLSYDDWATQIADRAVARLNQLRGDAS